MYFLEEIRQIFSALPAEMEEKKGLFTATFIIAERKTILSRQKLTYIAKFRIDDEKREVRFTEMLKESGWGVSSVHTDSTPGFGFKAEAYKTETRR